MNLKLVAALWLLVWVAAWAKPPALIPAPRQVVWTNEPFRLQRLIRVQAPDAQARVVADSVVAFLRQHGATSTLTRSEAGAQVVFKLEPSGAFRDKPEGYSITVSAKGAQLTAATERGLFWAYRTLQQLVQPGPNPSLAGCQIIDYPAFPVRGFMHDTGRSFITLDTLRAHLQQMSRYKLNTFHWHLTEDIAWRLASDSLPALTEAVNMQRDPGGFYTKAEVRELLRFARDRHIQIIPELDMPGHSAAFRRATGVDMQSEPGKKWAKSLIREVCALFDSPYLHIGTDEVAFRDSMFVPTMMAVVRECGKAVIGWYPGGTMDSTAIRQLWMSARKPLPGMRVIDSRDLYLNHYATQADLISLFQRDFCDVPEATPRHLGAIACIWNDRRPASTAQLERLNGLYPILLTFAERIWRGGGRPETETGVVLTDPVAFAEFEDRLLTHKRLHFGQKVFPYVRQSGLHWRILGPFPNGGNLNASFPPEEGNLHFPGVSATGATVYLRHTWGQPVVRSYLPDPKPNHTAYAFTEVYSPKAQTVGLWIDFHNYGRSEKDAAPPAGAWDHKGSAIWLNGERVPPPTWQQAGLRPGSLEQPYQNEPYEAREPITVSLKPGWNRVLLKLPVGSFSTPEYRLVKWLFTAVFVRREGAHWETADDLIFSPDRSLKTP